MRPRCFKGLWWELSEIICIRGLLAESLSLYTYVNKTVFCPLRSISLKCPHPTKRAVKFATLHRKLRKFCKVGTLFPQHLRFLSHFLSANLRSKLPVSSAVTPSGRDKAAIFTRCAAACATWLWVGSTHWLLFLWVFKFKKMTTAITTIAIQCEWIKTMPTFVGSAKNIFFGVPQNFNN